MQFDKIEDEYQVNLLDIFFFNEIFFNNFFNKYNKRMKREFDVRKMYKNLENKLKLEETKMNTDHEEKLEEERKTLEDSIVIYFFLK